MSDKPTDELSREEVVTILQWFQCGDKKEDEDIEAVFDNDKHQRAKIAELEAEIEKHAELVAAVKKLDDGMTNGATEDWMMEAIHRAVASLNNLKKKGE